MKKTWIVVGLILVVALIFLLRPLFTGKVIDNPSNLDDFAQCLTDSGWTMYGTEWCTYCKKQKDLFGNSFKYINYVDCDKEREICIVEGIQGYPSWKSNNQIYPGLQSLEKLSELSGCVLK